MRFPRISLSASPLAVATALSSAVVCLALFSGRVPPARPRPIQAAHRPVHRHVRLHRVAFRPEPLIQAAEFLSSAGEAPPQDTVHVLLTKAVQNGKCSVSCDSDLLVVNPETHSLIARVPAGKVYTLSMSEDGRAISGPGGSDLSQTSIRVLSLDASVPMTIGTRSYLGALDVRLGDKGLEVLNEVKREDYIAGVVAGESVRAFPLGALKAQAVAARTYALSQLGHRPDGVDVVDTVADQVYVGVRRDWPELRQAVEETAGVIATYHDEPITAYFSADCGGETRTNVAAGLSGHELPYLRPVIDAPKGGPDYCSASPKHTWTLTLKPTDIVPKLNDKAAAHLASVDSIRFTHVYSDGRVGEVEIEGKPQENAPAAPVVTADATADGKGDGAEVVAEPPVETAPAPAPVKITVTGFDFRKIVGTNVLKSQIMTVTPMPDGSWTFAGKGYGHGVGLCQWGACGMARAGIGFDAILRHYYTGIELQHQASRAGTLEGIARDLGGGIDKKAVVRLAGTNLQTISDSKGRFRFENLPVGTYDVVTTPASGEAAISFAWTVASPAG